MPIVYLFVLIYFIIGAIALFAIGKKKGNAASNKERWIKYFTYLLIVSGIIYSLLHSFFFYPGVLIVLLGLGELIYVWRKSNERKIVPFLTAVLIFSMLSYGFICYSVWSNGNKALFLYVLVFTFDGFSQISGQLLGKHKLAPAISPNKTIEGLAGGFVMLIVTGFYAGKTIYTNLTTILLMSVVIGISAFIGDLLASYYKRVYTVKDFSNLIPGHGGILDRFDSFIFAGAVYWLIN